MTSVRKELPLIFLESAFHVNCRQQSLIYEFEE